MWIELSIFICPAYCIQHSLMVLFFFFVLKSLHLCTKRCFVNGPSTLQFSKNKILNWILRHLYLFCDAELCDYSLKIVYTIFFSSQKAARGLNVYRVHVMHQCSSAVCHRVQACGNWLTCTRFRDGYNVNR